MSVAREGSLLALPLVVCLLNLGAPYLYRCLASLERHDSPVLEVYVAICRCVAGRQVGACWDSPSVSQALFPQPLCPPPLRNLILKMVILGILCYHWLGRRVNTLGGQVRSQAAGVVGVPQALRRV